MTLETAIALLIAAVAIGALTFDFYRTRHDRRLDRLVRRSKGRW